MNRRTFLGRLFTGAAVGVAATTVPLAKLLTFAPTPRPPMAITPAMARAITKPMAIRLIQNYDIAGQITRLDVLYGFADQTPVSVRVCS